MELQRTEDAWVDHRSCLLQYLNWNSAIAWRDTLAEYRPMWSQQKSFVTLLIPISLRIPMSIIYISRFYSMTLILPWLIRFSPQHGKKFLKDSRDSTHALRDNGVVDSPPTYRTKAMHKCYCKTALRDYLEVRFYSSPIKLAIVPETSSRVIFIVKCSCAAVSCINCWNWPQAFLSNFTRLSHRKRRKRHCCSSMGEHA